MTIEALLRSMTLAEKIGQLNHVSTATDTTGAAGAVADIESRIRRGEVGSIPAGLDVERLLRLQGIAVEESPHRIPLILTLDVIHGHRTIFPLPLGLACTWDANLVERTARVAATEAAAAGVALAWAPMLDVSRDARWGRCAESFGEDPLLGAKLGVAMIEGYQQDNLTRDNSMMACAKHFAGYGFAEGGRDYNVADINPYRMHNDVLPPFKAAVEAGVGAVMVGFHSLSGIPCTAHRPLLRELLRGRWGFDGLIVSDYTAILELVHHRVAADTRQAALLAFKAGVDVDMVSESYIRHLPELVAEQLVDEGEIDAACRRVLVAKQKLGLFDAPYQRLDEKRRRAVTLTPEHRQLAREAAAKACVLLKNSGALPLTRDKTVALIGPLADSRANMQGTWAVAAQSADSVTLLEGIQAAGCKVLHAKGANIVDDANIAARLNVFGETFAIDPRPPEEMIVEAVDVARRADVVIACVGEAKEHSGESSTRTEIGLPGSQQQLLQALHATGKPLVIIVMSGRPLALAWEDRHADAILCAWFAGSEAGNGIADVLFGTVNPSGKLAMSFPRSAGQCPIYYAEPPTGRPLGMIGIDIAGDDERDASGRRVFRKFTTACRVDGPSTPLYPFGYGLSYSTFDYGKIEVDKAVLRGGEVLEVSIDVRNSSARAGEEIVQLYIGDPVASRSRPVRELKDFRKIQLQPSEQRTVSFRITTADLTFYLADRLADPQALWEPGEFVIEIGRNSNELSAIRVAWQADT